MWNTSELYVGKLKYINVQTYKTNDDGSFLQLVMKSIDNGHGLYKEGAIHQNKSITTLRITVVEA